MYLIAINYKNTRTLDEMKKTLDLVKNTRTSTTMVTYRF